MRQLIFPVLRDDFAIFETYKGAPAASARLPCPLVALGGGADPRYTGPMLEAWKECAPLGPKGAPACTVQNFPGGHSYLFKEAESKTAFQAYLKIDLAAAVEALGEGPAAQPASPGGDKAPSSANSDAGATVASSGIYIRAGQAPVSGGGMSRVSSGGDGGGDRDSEGPGSPLWKAPQPSNRCCVFFSCNH